MRSLLYLSIILILILVLPADSAQAREQERLVQDGDRDNLGVFVFDGSGVHDIGELLLHTGNWGIFGSYPSSSWPVSQFPSAEWPAGSGVEHLYISGIWIGTRRVGIPRVSTSAFEWEFRPTDDAIDIIYSSFEGAPGGNRLPSPYADDDGDGLMDEDWLDGHDNDGDGLIDEDFAAISPQMFSSWYTDNQPIITDIYPDHEPLDIMVRQETYQWDDERFDDFVGVKFTVTNVGDEVLEDIYFGMFVDGDVGRRSDGAYWEDDAAGYWRGMRDTENGEVYVDIGYAYDYDGDGGRTTSYYGTMILGTSVAPVWSTEPGQAEWFTFRAFSGDHPYENGGDPTNDFQRYEVMSRSGWDSGGSGDCRYLCSTGAYSELQPGGSIVFHVANVCGDGLEGLLDNAASCKRLFDGITFEHNGEETQVHWMLEPPPLVIRALDIKPGTCKNPFNIKLFEFLMSGNPKKGGVMPVAILGGEGFDVTDIDISSIRLNGVAPLRQGQSYCDVAGPGEGDGDCNCSEEGPDGYSDLLLKFSNQEIAATRLILSIPVPGEKWTLNMTGELENGTVFNSSDCVTFVGEPPRSVNEDRPVLLTGEARLMGASPNPFNPATTIAFELAAPGNASISIYDVSGRLVRSLVDENLPAGMHEVIWNGRDGNGAMAASGVYFYRLNTGEIVQTRKMVLLR